MNAQQPWRRRQEIPDAQVRDAADQFEAARKVLDAQPTGSGILLPLMNTATMAIELYLKSLSAELVFTPIDDAIGGNRVTVAPAFGHRLTALLEKVPADVRGGLEHAFTNRSGGLTLHAAFERCEGAFAASRYPFELGAHLSKYPLDLLMNCSAFLCDYIGALEPVDRIEW
jgi:hypothetical protein